jgi:hypothetical protein
MGRPRPRPHVDGVHQGAGGGGSPVPTLARSGRRVGRRRRPGRTGGRSTTARSRRGADRARCAAGELSLKRRSRQRPPDPLRAIPSSPPCAGMARAELGRSVEPPQGRIPMRRLERGAPRRELVVSLVRGSAGALPEVAPSVGIKGFRPPWPGGAGRSSGVRGRETVSVGHERQRTARVARRRSVSAVRRQRKRR